MLDTIDQKHCPETSISPNCSSPYPCSLIESCWLFLPEHNVTELTYIGKKAFDLINQNVHSIKDIPDHFTLNAKQKIQKDCIVYGQPHIDRDVIAQFTSQLEYPLYFLDFETFSTAIPMHDGIRPYQNVPFQFSLHVVDKPDKKATHYSYLADGDGDPRPSLIQALKKHIGESGSIVAYNSSFEINVLRALGDVYPKHLEWITSTIERVIDLIVPFRSFGYYHPSQHGSASLKKVLPALTGTGYDGLGIAHGDDASLAYLRICSGQCTPEEHKQIRKDLEVYCELDTRGMIDILEKLTDL